MQTNISPFKTLIDDKRGQWPSVSVITPFEPVVQRKDELMANLQKIVKKVEWELGMGYDEDLVDLVLIKLRSIINHLNYSTFKKSLAIFVSPVFEKVMYMDVAVEETIMINESFIIRDIILAKKERPAYFVLVLNKKWSTVYEGNECKLIKVKSNGIGNIPAFRSSFSKLHEEQKMNPGFFVEHFFKHTDEGLSVLLSAMPRPVLVLGNKEVIDAYKAITVNSESIVEYVEGNFGKTTEEDMFREICGYITDWDKIKIKHLYHQLEKAAREKKLVSGLEEVHRSVLRRRNRLLVIAKSLFYNPDIVEIDESLKGGSRFNKFSCVKHILDDIIEKVLSNGGDVDLVDDDVLGGQQIVLLNDKLKNT